MFSIAMDRLRFLIVTIRYGEDLMPVRLFCCVALMAAVLMPHGAHAGCTQEIGKLMSRDTEKLTTRYNRIAQQAQRPGASAKLLQEECRIARKLKPRLEDQLAALKGSGCARDPKVG